MTSSILDHLIFLYGEAVGQQTYEKVQQLLAAQQSRLPEPGTVVFSERDTVLITYGDQVQVPG